MISTSDEDDNKAVLRNIVTNLSALKECETVAGPSSLQTGQIQILDHISFLNTRLNTERYR